MQALGGGFAALAGVLFELSGAPPGTGSVAAGALQSPLTVALSRMGAEVFGRPRRLEAIAVSQSRLTDEEFMTRLAGDPRLSALAARSLIAVQCSAYEPKLRALGCVLGDQVRGDGRMIDEAELLAEVLGKLEAAHVAVLHSMIERDEQGQVAQERGEAAPEINVAVRAGLPSELAGSVTYMLNALGLLDAITSFSIVTYRVNDLGREVDRVLRLAAESDTIDSVL